MPEVVAVVLEDLVLLETQLLDQVDLVVVVEVEQEQMVHLHHLLL